MEELFLEVSLDELENITGGTGISTFAHASPEPGGGDRPKLGAAQCAHLFAQCALYMQDGFGWGCGSSEATCKLHKTYC